MSYYDQDVLNDYHRPSLHEDDVHQMGQRTKPHRHTYHPHHGPGERAAAAAHDGQERFSHEQQSFVEIETQGQGQG